MESHKIFGTSLDTNMVNKLVQLFDNKVQKHSNPNYKIAKFIENERKARRLNTSDITVSSEVYGENCNNSTLFLIIRKNNIDILHLSIHLAVKSLNPKSSGIIHISKNICKKIKISKNNKIRPYVLISVQQPIDKPHSLEFSIAEGYNTLNASNAALYDPMLQQEMDVIITVLNRIFDENNKEFYIGNSYNYVQIHNNTNAVLKNINNHREHVTRKNAGTRVMPLINSIEPPLKIDLRALKSKLKSKKNTRKLHKPR